MTIDYLEPLVRTCAHVSLLLANGSHFWFDPRQLIRDWGYLALLVGTFLEGETIVIVAGVVAKQGLLELRWVILCAFAGTFASDQLFFHLGRSKGLAFIQKRPKWKKRTEKVLGLLHKHQILVVLGFRFLYGVRNVTPFAIGCTGIKSRTFFFLNFIGALVWAMVFATCGFVFGHAIEIAFGKLKHHADRWLLAILVIGLLTFLIHRLVARKVVQRNSENGGSDTSDTPTTPPTPANPNTPAAP